MGRPPQPPRATHRRGHWGPHPVRQRDRKRRGTRRGRHRQRTPGPPPSTQTQSAGGGPPAAPWGAGRGTAPVPRAGPPPPFAQAMTPTGTGHGVGTQAYVQKSRQYGPRPAPGPDARLVPRRAGTLGAVPSARPRLAHRDCRRGQKLSRCLSHMTKPSLIMANAGRVPPPAGCRNKKTAREALSLQGSAGYGHKAHPHCS